MDKIVKIKIAAYFFCVVGSASLCAMELESKKSEDFCVVKKALLCDEIMKTYGVPHEVAAIVKGNSHLLRMDTIYKKFDPFFHFNEHNYKKYFNDYRAAFTGETYVILGRELILQEAKKYAHAKCRKFDVVTPQHLFFFTENQDEILSSLISRQRCFIHHKGDCHIKLTKERETYLMLPSDFRYVLRIYPRFYV